jgi:hypothetical protein
MLPENEGINLNWNHIYTSEQTKFCVNKTNKYRVAMNCLANRFHVISDKIPLLRFNKSFTTFKIECKKLFLNR